MESTIRERVVKTLVQVLGIKSEECKNESNIQEDLGADSLDVVELVMALEENFDVSIADEDVTDGKYRTVGHIINEIDKLTSDPKHCSGNRPTKS